MTQRARARYRVTGVVQGVGFRPFVYVTATELGLDRLGRQRRPAASSSRSRASRRRRRARAPAGHRRTAAGAGRAGRRRTEQDPVGGTGFTIAESDRTDRPGARTFAAPDVATCADCLRELADPADRRYRHPFITCTNCGPRFTHHHATCPTTGRPRRWPASRCAPRAPRSTPTRPTGGSTPSRSPATTAGRGWSWCSRGAEPLRGDEALARPAGCWPRARSSRSRGSAATTWPATPATTGAVADPAGSQAPRGQAVRRDGAPTSTPPARWSTSTTPEAALLTGSRPADRAARPPPDAVAGARAGRRARQPGPRPDAALHPAAHLLLGRAGRRTRRRW